MKKLSLMMLFGFFVVFTGCYNATIDTGKTPSTVTIEEKWAAGWIVGLVPPKTVETMDKCPNGVAKVSTKLSFLNMLVGNLTFGVYTPMEVIVTCAANSTAEADLPDDAELISIPKDSSAEEKEKMYEEAIIKSSESESDVYIQFER